MQIANDLQMALSPVDFFRCATTFEPNRFSGCWKILESQSQKIAMMLSRQWGKRRSPARSPCTRLYTSSPARPSFCSARSLRQSTEAMAAITKMYGRLSGEAVEPVIASSALRLKFKNGSRILALPGSGDATVRRTNAVMIICDEASRVEKSLVDACQPYLATKGNRGRLVFLTTPLVETRMVLRSMVEGRSELAEDQGRRLQ